ncbi:hypothetical protein GCM10009789_55960 [Kribbella sancticallisti]|uniref:DUF6318 domain-containing protein n=1 Tax=Kribbella sancticallisti TaxID=460087 RepID=A0ABN2E4R7_9ACTN
MTQRSRTRSLIAVYLGTALALTACAAKSPEAGRPNTAPVTPDSPSVRSTTATAQPTIPPERPQSANGLTLASAELFIRHYIDLMNYAAKTGDTSALRDASDLGCVGCGKYFASVEKVNQQNGGLSGDYQEKVVEVVELTRAEQKRLAASTAVTVGNYVARQSPASAPVTVKASAYTEEMVLSPNGGNWQMFEMELIKR